MGDNMSDLKIQGILKQLDKDLVPDPYLLQKVWTKTSEKKGYRREIFFWRGLSLASMSLLAILLVYPHQPEALKNPTTPINNAIVFHLDNESGIAYENVRMEMEIPEGVEFNSSNAQIAKKKMLSLNTGRFDIGKSRLPFVVKAKTPGPKQFKIHVFDEHNNLIKEKIVTIQFSDEQNKEKSKEKII
jgi:hypothetical protein